jgi:DNA modification methylase
VTKNPLGQKQLLLPLLNVIHDMGGAARPCEAIETLTERLHVPAAITDRKDFRKSGKWEGTRYSPWKSSIHWARLDAVKQGFLTGEIGKWELTDKAYEGLGKCRPGVVIKIFETPRGEFLWAEAESVVRMMNDKSVNLIFTSPPYKLQGVQRQYKNKTSDYMSWLIAQAHEWKRVLTDDGSLVVNLGEVWIPESGGMRDPYLYRFLLAAIDEVGFHFADIHHWLNTSGGPRGHCVTNARTRLNQNVEPLFWLTKTLHPKANNRNVLAPYKKATLDTYARKAARARTYGNPSGRNSNGTADPAKTGGAIPSTCLQIPNSTSSDAYMKGCRAAGLPIHPARFPKKLVDFHVRFLTDPKDRVADFMAGSGTVAEVCEELDREWVAGDCMKAYIHGALHRPSLAEAAHVLEGGGLLAA